MLALKNIVRTLPLAKTLFKPTLLCQTNLYSFAFMQLFQRNKLPPELDPVFKRETKPKGHLKSKARKNYSKKLNTTTHVQKQKLKNHKGLLKRLKIVGPRYKRQFKFLSPSKQHLNRNKSRANLIRKRRARYVHASDMRRVKKLIPYFKRKSLKMRY